MNTLERNIFVLDCHYPPPYCTRPPHGDGDIAIEMCSASTYNCISRVVCSTGTECTLCRHARSSIEGHLDTISPKQDQKHRHDQASPSVMKSAIFFGADLHLEPLEFVERPLPWQEQALEKAYALRDKPDKDLSRISNEELCIPPSNMTTTTTSIHVCCGGGASRRAFDGRPARKMNFCPVENFQDETTNDFVTSRSSTKRHFRHWLPTMIQILPVVG
jgi:hypothetical protein